MQTKVRRTILVLASWMCFGTIVGYHALGQERSSRRPLLSWRQLAPVPDELGLAAPFAGLHGTTLLVGGGANFPNGMPWAGGTKVWHDRVWAFDHTNEVWREAGRLPMRLAYGVSVSMADGVVCIGGSDSKRHYADVFQLLWRDDKLETKALPSLPCPVANACGAMLGQTIYVAGGLELPDSSSALKTFFALDLSANQLQWKSLEAWPGPPRMLAVAAVQDDRFFLIGGAELLAGNEGHLKRRYLNDAYQFRPGIGWKQIADVPQPVAASPSPAPTMGASQFIVIGGDDGSKVGFQPPQNHPGFSSRMLAYDTLTNAWSDVGTTPAPRATAPTLKWRDQWLIISGELRPGIRSPEVWSLQITQ